MSGREGVALIEVEVEDAAWAGVPEVEALVEGAAMAALTHLSLPRHGRACPGHDGEKNGGSLAGPVTILLTDDATVRDLNARFRAKDYATNVLSFPAALQPGLAGPQPLGDLALAYGVCATEAAAQGKTLADHLRHLVVHGVLHLLGHDHEDDAEAEAMEALEREILASLGVADPYRAEAGHV